MSFATIDNSAFAKSPSGDFVVLKVLLVFGTRPEAIKMAPLVKEFRKYPERFDTKVCVTGQHRQMLDQVLEVFDIQPDYDLNVMAPDQDLYDITSKILLGMRDVLLAIQPDIVFVHGDTTTSMATAIAAFYQQIKVAHVEAGLRTYNLRSPWPEEMNRQLTDSGGVQEEAPSLGKPVLVMRNTTERPEAVEAGTVKLVGTDAEAIVENVNLLLNDRSVYDCMAMAHNPYGDGKACGRIVEKF